MAKLKAPLFSLGASGAIGEALVYFGWKGLNVVREYVVPSNPQTSGQTTQRGHLTDMVDAIHDAQALAAIGLDEEDVMAYALLASTRRTPRTWFNECVKLGIDQLVAGLLWAIWHNGHLTPGANQLTFVINTSFYSGAVPTTARIRWGTSKTALINIQATTRALLAVGVVIPALTTGVKYYAQVEAILPTGYIGAISGIYYGVAA